MKDHDSVVFTEQLGFYCVVLTEIDSTGKGMTRKLSWFGSFDRCPSRFHFLASFIYAFCTGIDTYWCTSSKTEKRIFS